MIEFNNERPYGVELEIEHGDPEEMYHTLSKAGIPVTNMYPDPGHSSDFCRWTIKYDGSIDEGYEICSPILSGLGSFDAIELVCHTLINAGARVNRTCSLHIHHGVMDKDSALTLARLYYLFSLSKRELQFFFPASRRANEYCKIDHQTRLGRLTKELFTKHPGQILIQLCNNGRYQALNFESFPLYGTIEFRQHHGTLESGKILPWIVFTQGLIESSINVKEINSIYSKKSLLKFFRDEMGWHDKALAPLLKATKLYILKRVRIGKHANEEPEVVRRGHPARLVRMARPTGMEQPIERPSLTAAGAAAARAVRESTFRTNPDDLPSEPLGSLRDTGLSWSTPDDRVAAVEPPEEPQDNPEDPRPTAAPDRPPTLSPPPNLIPTAADLGLVLRETNRAREEGGT